VSVAARVLRVAPGEGRIAGLVVVLAFVAMASATLGESGIDALFFERIGTDALPAMYLLQAAVAFVAMLALTGILGRLGHRRAYLAGPSFLAVVLIAERAVLLADVRWIYPVLWVTVALGTLVLGVVLWGTAGAVVDTRQAKRLFPIFGAGGILGSVVGGLATRPLAPVIGAENLLLVWAGGLLVVFALCRVVLGAHVPVRRGRASRRRPSALRDLAQGLGFVRRSRLLVWMTVAAVLFSVLYYSLYLPYAQAATEHFPDADRLAGFFGLFWAGVTGAAFLVSMLLTNRLFGWFGVAAMVVVLPLLYAGAFGILLVDSAFLTLVVLRFVTAVWLQGVASPGWETLVNVVPDTHRDQTRAFMNGGPSQAGTAIAGLVALVGQDVLSSRALAAIGLAAAVATVLATLAIRRSYTGALVDALHAGRPQVFERPTVRTTALAPDADAEAASVLARAARSPDVRVRRLAFELATRARGRPPIDDLREGLADPDALVRLATVRAMADADDAGGARVLRLLDDPDPAVRGAAAAASLARYRDRASMVVDALAHHSDAGIRRTLVEQLDRAPGEDAARVAADLTDDADPAVRASALERLAGSAPNLAFDRARAALADPDARVRLAAGRALGEIGERAIGPALDALPDPATNAAAIEILRRATADGSRAVLVAFVRGAADRAGADRDLAAAIPAEDPATSLLRDALLDRGRRTARSALWAASTMSARRDAVQAAIENLDAGPIQLANALETLEAAGDVPSVRVLVSLWEPSSGRHHGGDGWLRRAVEDDDRFIGACAALVRARREGETMARTPSALSVIERVLLLRQVPLFAGLSPSDLERVAEVAEERGYADGELVAAEGEPGDELHLIVEGTIRVVHDRDGDEREIARRRSGDVVGEMSIIAGAPRVASLVADGPVRTLRIGHHQFESMLRERPDLALGVMRVLVERLAERSGADPRTEG
jgi:HEAT repeat protein